MLRAKCETCGRSVLLSSKGVFPKHQVKGGAFCSNAGAKPRMPVRASVAPRARAAERGGTKAGSRKRRVRVIRLGRGPMGSQGPVVGPRIRVNDLAKGFWRPGKNRFEQRPDEE